MRKVFPSSVIVLALTLLLAGCASTTLQSAWFDSEFKGPPFKRVLVVGVTGNFTDRRVFDETFAQLLTDAGTQGIPGFQYVDNVRGTDNAAFDAGVAKSGADAVLLVRLLGVDMRTQVTTTMVPAMGGSPFAGPFGGPFGGPTVSPWGPVWYAVPEVRQFQLANVEATLFEAVSHRPVWSATTQTFNPTSVAQETPGFARLVIGQLQARGLIAPSK
ncbi:MAG TPA: hypothetical protein VIK97_13180 [Casimicrobiaceae bacterium]